jgi:predicted transcriptional regulator
MANEAAAAQLQTVPQILFRDKQARIILLLKNSQQPWYLSTLSKACDTTYVHTSNFIKTCESLGITTNEKHGKIKEIKLTERGMQLAELLSVMYGIINQTSAQQQKVKASEPAKEEKKEAKEENKEEKK